MPFPFEVPFEEIEHNLDAYVDTVFSCLQSEFLTLPKGPDFIDYPVFERGYEALKQATGDFRDMAPEPVIGAIYRFPIAFLSLSYRFPIAFYRFPTYRFPIAFLSLSYRFPGLIAFTPERSGPTLQQNAPISRSAREPRALLTGKSGQPPKRL